MLETIGLRGPRWEWRKQAWRRALEDRLAAWQNVERGLRATTRMCRSCRLLVPIKERTCPSCGASMRGVPAGGWSRLLKTLVPGAGTVTTTLVSANVAMAVLVVGLSGAAAGGGAAFARALMSPSSKVLFALGAKYTPAILAGEFWRLVTAGYLHGGLLHLMFNCYALANLGPLVEEAFGGRRLFVLYTFSGVAAFIASTLFSPASFSVGASGSLFGLLGFAFVYGRFRGGTVGRAVADQLLRWIILGAVMVFLPGIDNAAHAGGLACGALLGMVFDPGAPRSRSAEVGLGLFTALAAVVTIAAFVMMVLSLWARVAVP